MYENELLSNILAILICKKCNGKKFLVKVATKNKIFRNESRKKGVEKSKSPINLH